MSDEQARGGVRRRAHQARVYQALIAGLVLLVLLLQSFSTGRRAAGAPRFVAAGGAAAHASVIRSAQPMPTDVAATAVASSSATPSPAAVSTPTSLSAAPQNAIQVENAYTGTSAWQINQQATSGHLIEGYANLTSVNVGAQIIFYVNVVPTSPYTLDIFRMGWYQGLGARLMREVSASNLAGTAQPRCPMTARTGLVECAWRRSYTLGVPSNWTSGVYLALLTRLDGYQNYIIFVVRDDRSTAAYLFQSSVTTFEAYNNWGGKSLYGGSGPNAFTLSQRAYQVSFDRPYLPLTCGTYDFLCWEYPMLRWMERQGYDVTYATDVDTDEQPGMLRRHRAFLSVGHDEYWSTGMRDHVEAALAAGVNLGFFGADAMYWHIRLGPSPLGRDRVITCYKSASLDPLNHVDRAQVTVPWRSAPLNRPENAIIGEMYSSSIPVGSGAPGAPFVVTDPRSWVYRGVDVTRGSALPNMVGYEYDRVFDNGFTPAGLTIVSRSPLVDAFGSRDVANATVYTAPSGATVFAAGSIYWADGLDDGDNNGIAVLDSRVQGITANVLARLGQARGRAPVWPTALPTAIPGSSLISNGSFEQGKAPWQFMARSGAITGGAWTLDGVPSAHLHVNGRLPVNAPSVQLMQHIGTLQGRVYTLRFWGRASSVRTVRIVVQTDSDGNVLATPDLTLTRAWQGFEFTFQGEASAAGTDVSFKLDPHLPGDVWLGRVDVVAGQPSAPLGLWRHSPG